MALPEEELIRVKELLEPFCLSVAGDSVRLEFHMRGNSVTLVESRPLFIDPQLMNSVNIAQFEFNADLKIWTLYWYDRKNRRQPYPTGRNRDTLERLVAEVRSDPTGIFWE
jgi:hypothetical protein